MISTFRGKARGVAQHQIRVNIFRLSTTFFRKTVATGPGYAVVPTASVSYVCAVRSVKGVGTTAYPGPVATAGGSLTRHSLNPSYARLVFLILPASAARGPVAPRGGCIP